MMMFIVFDYLVFLDTAISNSDDAGVGNVGGIYFVMAVVVVFGIIVAVVCVMKWEIFISKNTF